MIRYGNPNAIRLRNLLRRIGVLWVLKRLRRRFGNYEDAFETRLVAAIREGECVWDVGANVGYYTSRCAAAVGASGRVVAFEPSPPNRQRLMTAVAALDQVQVRAEALGKGEGVAILTQGSDTLGATSRIGHEIIGSESYPIAVATGDRLVADGEVPPPNIIKIDVEGFELDVLRGLSDVLLSPDLHTIGIEVHFLILAQTGNGHAPSGIEAILRSAGFQCTWADSSHLIAARAKTASQ